MTLIVDNAYTDWNIMLQGVRALFTYGIVTIKFHVKHS